MQRGPITAQHEALPGGGLAGFALVPGQGRPGARLLPWERDRGRLSSSRLPPATALVWWPWLCFLICGHYVGAAHLSSFVILAPPSSFRSASLPVDGRAEHRCGGPAGTWGSTAPAADHPPRLSRRPPGAGEQSRSWGRRQRQGDAGPGRAGGGRGEGVTGEAGAPPCGRRSERMDAGEGQGLGGRAGMGPGGAAACKAGQGGLSHGLGPCRRTAPTPGMKPTWVSGLDAVRPERNTG